MGWQDGHGGAFGGGSWNGAAHTRGGFSGGFRGGGFGGGSGGNSGAPMRTGLTTGSTWYGNTAFGQPGGMAQGYATKGANGQFGNFRSLTGQAYTPQQRGSYTPAKPYPGGYVTPVKTQPIPPSPVTGALPPPAPVPPPPSVMPPVNPWTFMPNPTAYAQHTQPVPGQPRAVQGTYKPRSAWNSSWAQSWNDPTSWPAHTQARPNGNQVSTYSSRPTGGAGQGGLGGGGF
jgi:hypothetical protein